MRLTLRLLPLRAPRAQSRAAVLCQCSRNVNNDDAAPNKPHVQLHRKGREKQRAAVLSSAAMPQIAFSALVAIECGRPPPRVARGGSGQLVYVRTRSNTTRNERTQGTGTCTQESTSHRRKQAPHGLERASSCSSRMREETESRHVTCALRLRLRCSAHCFVS